MVSLKKRPVGRLLRVLMKRPSGAKDSEDDKPLVPLAKRPAGRPGGLSQGEDGDASRVDPPALLDNPKKRKFHQIFGELPVPVQDEFKALKSTQGSSRAITQLINSAITRRGQHLVVEKQPSKWLQERIQHKRERYKDESLGGVILEVAETQLGGSAKLQRAVAEGRVKKKTSRQGIDFYFLPSVVLGARETFCKQKEGHKQNQVSNEGFEEIQGAMPRDEDWESNFGCLEDEAICSINNYKNIHTNILKQIKKH